MLKTTIVLATANRPKLVLDCIDCVEKQIPPELEVLVVDAGKDKPVDAVAVKERWTNSQVIAWPEMNMAAQRNEGIRRAQGDIVIFLDDDCYVQDGWWPSIIQPLLNDSRKPEARSQKPDDSNKEQRTKNKEQLAKARIGAVAGAVWVNPNPRLTDDRAGYVNAIGIPQPVAHRGAGTPQEIDWTVGSNMAFLKKAAVEVGGLCEAFSIYDEDVDFGLRLRKAGWRIVYQHDAAVYHYCYEIKRPPPTKQSQFRLGRNRAMMLVRNFGLSPRLFLFVMVMPWVKVGQAIWASTRGLVTAFGHSAAYVCGMLKGVVAGMQHPASRDKGVFEKDR